MLLVIHDRRLAPGVREWTTRTIAAGVRTKERGVVVVESLGDEALRTSGGQVVAIRSDTEYDRLLAAVAGAGAMVLITRGTAQGVRPWLQLDSSAGYKVPVLVVVVTEEPLANLDVLAATAGVSLMHAIRPAPNRKSVRLLRRIGRQMASYAVLPRRFEASDAATHRAGARQQAERILGELLADDKVEEYQTFGGGRMQIQFSDGGREDRESPFPTDRSLEEAIRFLATFGGDRPHRFDEQSPRLDMNLKDR